MQKIAFIFGITGQDGATLAKFLLDKGYHVVGAARRSSVDSKWRLRKLKILNHPDFQLVDCDITDAISVYNLFISLDLPDEVYNLAAMSFVQTSFTQPSLSFQVNTLGCLNVLEAIRRFAPLAKYYFAATSEMFGNSVDNDGFQRETTPMVPTSPYAISKLAGFNLVKNYREAYNLFACSGILFNHSGPLRGDEFVEQKIAKYVAGVHRRASSFDALRELLAGDSLDYEKLRLGNLKASRDWGLSNDYVRAMWLMLQQDKPDDFVIATGESRTIEELLLQAFTCIGCSWWERFVEIDQNLIRPSDLHYLNGDSTKARKVLGWEPSVTFKELVEIMVKAAIDDTAKLQRPTLQEVA